MGSAFLISDFRRDLNIEYLLLGISPASNCSWPTFTLLLTPIHAIMAWRDKTELLLYGT